jgi:DNA-binding transcriptional regulator LsrR (DeoR family)
MNEIENSRLTTTIVQVARLYFEQNLSQKEIADKLGVSRSLIALYLKKAKDLQIVKFEIRDPIDNCEDLALTIKSKTNLKRVVIVPTSHNSADLTRRSIAGALARYLENSLQNGDCLGIGFGRTIAELSGLLTPSNLKRINVVPIIGESAASLIGTYSQVNVHALKIASSFGGIPHFLLAPLMVESQALRDLLVADMSIKPVIDLWNRLTHVCVGIGTLPPVQGEIIYIGEENLKSFSEAGGVGDICTRYYDKSGKFIESSLHERIIGIRIDQIRKARHVIAVASGTEKAFSTASLLRSNILTDLFVDENLAKAMLSELK